MNFSLTRNDHRPLSIDYDLYTDGDEVFKKDLIVMMIENLQELQQAITVADKQNSAPGFFTSVHKVKTTLTMLNDRDLDAALVEAQSEGFFTSAGRDATVITVIRVCNEIIRSLQKDC